MDIQRMAFLGFTLAFGGVMLFIAGQLMRWLLLKLAAPSSPRR